MKIEQITDKFILRSLLKSWKQSEGIQKFDRAILGDADMLLWRGVKVIVAYDGDQGVSLNIIHAGKRKKNVWEPYANFYTAWTLPSYRRQGWATELYRHREQECIEYGCRRLKALAGTRLGAAFHRSLNHPMWCSTDKDELCVDYALISDVEWPNSTPIGVRKYTDVTEPLEPSEVERRMSTGLRFDPQ
jgi:GNAT superfamily N-acetyltransferase